MNIKGY